MLFENENNKSLNTIYCLFKWLVVFAIFLTSDKYIWQNQEIFTHIVSVLVGIGVWNGCIYYIYKKLEQMEKSLYGLSIIEVIGDIISVTCLAWAQGNCGDSYLYILFIAIIGITMVRYGNSLVSIGLIAYVMLNVFAVYRYVYVKHHVLQQQKLVLFILISIGIILYAYYTVEGYKNLKSKMEGKEEDNKKLQQTIEELSYLNEMASFIYKCNEMDSVILRLFNTVYKFTKSEGIGVILYGENNVESDARYYNYKDSRIRHTDGEVQLPFKPFYAQLQLQNIRTQREYKNCILSHEPISVERYNDQLLCDILPDTDEKYIYLFNIIKEDQECGMVICNVPQRLDISVCKQIDALVRYVGFALFKIQLLQRERTKVMTDTLTGVGSRRYIEEILVKYIKKAKHNKVPIGVLFADIDHFKYFNDTYGHHTGDLVLKEVAHIMEKHIEGYGVVGRYGGEEFIGLLYGQDTEKSYEIAEKIRQDIANHTLEGYTHAHTTITLSIGVAIYTTIDNSIEEVIGLADQAMYEAKKERNKVCVYTK